MSRSKKRFTDKEIKAWQERHDLEGMPLSEARAAFEDAASIWMDREPATPPAAPGAEARIDSKAVVRYMQKPSAKRIDSACMSYRHDFGLLSAEEQSQLRHDAKHWGYAWAKELFEPAIPEVLSTPTPPQAASEYDKAVEELAPYLPDGWVAQDMNVPTYWFEEIPETYHGAWERGESLRPHGNLDPVVFPATDWRASLRRIENGSVVRDQEGS